MDKAKSLVLDVPGFGPEVRRIQLECGHGRTVRLVSGGSKTITDGVLLDLVRVLHGAANVCQCATSSSLRLPN